MLSWLFLAGLGIIWVAFLLPLKRRASPSSSVEAFERKMGLLAEANRSSSGRWVVMPAKGERILGPGDRQRVRVRRRRRQILTLLLELAGLTLLIGMFPLFRPMLVVSLVLGVALLAYVGFLAKLQADERHRIAHGQGVRAVRTTGQHANGNGLAHANGNGAPHPNGDGPPRRLLAPLRRSGRVDLRTDGIRIVGDDVHVVIRKARELETEGLDSIRL